MQNVILTDVDGVLLNWYSGFTQWMLKNGHKKNLEMGNAYELEDVFGVTVDEIWELISRFNTSAYVGFLSPFPDAVKYVRKLADEGYKFHAITSMHDEYCAHKLREMNLESVFGKDIFERYVFLGLKDEKDSILAQYEGSDCYWVEDKVSNAEAGFKFGLNPILVNHPYNTECSHIHRVNNWRDIYEIVKGETFYYDRLRQNS